MPNLWQIDAYRFHLKNPNAKESGALKLINYIFVDNAMNLLYI